MSQYEDTSAPMTVTEDCAPGQQATGARARRHRAGKLALVLAMVLVAETGIAVAATSEDVVNSATAATAADPAATEEERQSAEEVQARFTALLKGKRVEIPSLRSEDSSTFANPDGTLTTESFTGPVRVRQQSGTWQDIDTTLKFVDGEVRPRVAAADISFSAGGDKAALAAVDSGNHALGVDWQGTLPKPELDGNTATYRNVVQGGDLTVTALPEGFAHTVVLRERPKDQLEFRLPVVSENLTLEETGDQRLRWENGEGKQIASAPVPQMWDSSRDPASGESKNAAPVDAQVEADPGGGGQTLVLRPDEGFLADPDLKFPVVIDPTNTLMGPVTDTWVQHDAYPNSQRGSTELKAGSYDGVQRARSYLKFDVAQYAGKHITDTDLRLYSYYSSTCATTGSGVQARRVTADWDPSAITWGAQPATTTDDAKTTTSAKGYSSSCPAGHVSWDIDGIVQDWANGEPNYGVRLAAVTETDPLTWRRYRSANYVDGSHDAATEPSLTVTYNSYPAVPTAVTAEPVRKGTSSLTVASLTPVLSAKVTDADTGSSLKAQFEISADPAHADSTHSWTGTSASYVPGSTATMTVPTANKLPEGAHLRMRSRTYDGVDYSTAWSSWVPFRVDTSEVQAGDAPSHLRTGGTSTLTPLLSGVVSAPSGGMVDAEFTLSNSTGNALGTNPLGSHRVPSGDRAAYQVPAGLLSDGGSYTWKMRACHEGKCSPYSSAQSFTVKVVAEETEEAVDKTLTVTGSGLAYGQVAMGSEACGGECPGTQGGTTLRVGGDGTKVWRSYLKPDLSALPAGARVTAAKLRLSSTGCPTSCGTDPLEAHALNGSWTADQMSTDLEAITAPDANATATAPWEFDVTELVTGWREGSDTNTGLALQTGAESASGQGVTFASPSATDATKRPKLEIAYLAPTAPGPVRAPTAEAGDTGALVTWTAPEDSGYNGSDITYKVTALDSEGKSAGEVSTTDTSAVLTGLANGSAYTFRVTASTTHGTGETVTTSSATPAAVPEGGALYRSVLQQYLDARAGITTGKYASAAAATAAASHGNSFSWMLGAENSGLIEERDSLRADGMGYSAVTSDLTDVLAMPAADGRSVTLRASVSQKATPTDTEDSPAESAQTWRYTFRLDDRPILERKVDAGQAERPLASDSTVFGAVGHGGGEEDTGTASTLPLGAMPEGGVSLSGEPFAASAEMGTYATLNASGTAKYARDHWRSSSEFSQDCTNFTSKSLFYGGKMRMKGVEKNKRSQHNWWRKYHYGPHGSRTKTWSHTWSVANYQNWFFLEHSNGRWLGQNQGAAKLGDIVFFDWRNERVWDHAAVVTKVRNGKAYVSAHNKNRLNKPIGEYLTGDNRGTVYSIVRVKPGWY